MPGDGCGVYGDMGSTLNLEHPGFPPGTLGRQLMAMAKRMVGASTPSRFGVGTAGTLRPSTPEGLFRQSYRSIVQSLALAGGDLAAAEDATQDAFVEAYLRWDSISGYDNPAAWVRRVAINKLRNMHRSRVRAVAALLRLAAEDGTVAQVEADPGVIGALRSLPSRQRLAAVLYYVEDLPVIDVALAMGISEGSVAQHLSRARTSLRAELEGQS